MRKVLSLVLVILMFVSVVPFTATAGLADDIKCAAGNHATTKEEVVTAATCGTVGVARVYCSNCNELLETKVIPATGVHTPVNVSAVSATCLTAGLTEGTKCSVCEDILSGCELIPTTGHCWSELETNIYTQKVMKCSICGQVEIQGEVKVGDINNFNIIYNCTSATLDWDDVIGATGYEIYLRIGVESSYSKINTVNESNYNVSLYSKNNYSFKVRAYVTIEHETFFSGFSEASIDYNGHYEEVEIMAIAPTCTESGRTTGKMCSACGEIIVNSYVIPALGHDFDIKTISPTCTEKGEEISSCINCNEVVREEIEPIGHYWLTDEEIPSSCTSEGKLVTWCFNCGERKEEKVIEKIPHNYQSEWQTIIAPTCTATGVSIKICRGCFNIQTSTLPVVSHTDTNGDYKCDICSLDMTPSQPAEPDTPEIHVCKDENSDGICDTCGYDFTQDCDCGCHKSGIAKFFFNIRLFFNKLFKKNAVCDCGVAHY